MHTSVSRAFDFLLDLTGLKFLSADTVLHAYLHFEALTKHEYKYSCVTCGDYPPVVIMDRHKKGVFQFSGMFIAIMFTSKFVLFIYFLFIFSSCYCHIVKIFCKLLFSSSK